MTHEPAAVNAMSIWTRLRAAIASAIQRVRNRIAFRRQALAATSDGKLSAPEAANLFALKRQLAIDDQTARSVGADAYVAAYRAAVADGRVTREEELELQRIQEYFDVPQQAIAATQMELARFRLLRHISEGDLPNVAVPGLALQKHEVSHWVEPASLLEERVLNREYVGQSRGVSVRIARGVTYRVGAQRGRMVTTTGIVVVSRGSVVITNKRVVFRGDTKGFSIRLDQLLDAQVFEDGLRLMDGSGKARQLQLATVRDVDILAAILSQVLSNVAA